VDLLYLFGALLVVCVAGQLVLLLRGVLSAEAVMHQPRRSVTAHLLAVTAMAYLLLAGWTTLAQSTTGDEPHYLLATHSLWRDGDVELGRTYAARDFAAFYPTDLLRRALGVRLELDPHDTPGADSRGRLVGWLVSWLAPNQQTSKPANQQTSKRSGRYPIHSLGLSLLILPAYAVAGHVGVVVFLTLLAALLAVSAFWLTDELFGERRAALFAWATFAFLTPLLYYSGMVQAEVTAGLSLALLVGIAWRAPAETHRKTALTVGSIALFALPWLHVKFIPLAGLLLVIWLVRGSWLVDSSKVGSLVSWLVGSLRGSRPASQQTSKPANQQTSKLLLWPVAAFVASLLALALFHQSIYGSPWPDAPHRNAAGKYPSLLSGNPLRGGFGLLLDQQDGLLPAALVLWLAGPGLLRAVRGFRISDFGFRKTDFEASDPQSRFRNSQSENGRRAVPVAAALLGSVFGVQFALLAPYLLWGSGYGPPGRQLLPVLALIMPFVGLGWQACEEALPSPQWGGVGGGVRRAWWLVPTLFNGLWVILLTIVPRLRFPLYDDTLSIARQPVITLLSAATHLDWTWLCPSFWAASGRTYLIGTFYLLLWAGLSWRAVSRYPDP
jgi:hypothetical protein